jgi:nucleoside-diphosphate-sugar epimerase
MKRVMITGASGFIGSYLVNHLKGFEIQTLSLQDPTWSTKPLDCDVIIHCAGLAHATTSIQEADYQRVNCDFTAKLYTQAIQQHVKQFIFLSSALVFGEGHVGPITYKSPINPKSPYARSKVCAEQALIETSHIQPLILRLPLVLGDAPKGNLKSLAKLARLSPVFLQIPNRRSVLTLPDLTATIQSSIDSQAQGIVHPVSYDCSTSELYASYRRHTWMIPIPTSWMKFLRRRFRVFGKLFGDFYYQNNAS